jgi:hypothetical protein
MTFVPGDLEPYYDAPEVEYRLEALTPERLARTEAKGKLIAQLISAAQELGFRIKNWYLASSSSEIRME